MVTNKSWCFLRDRIEAERKEAERIERERIARERAIAKELARIEAERIAAERKAREEARREADRIKREEAKRKIEEEKAKKEEKERLKFEAQEAIRQEKEDALRRKIEEAPSTPKRAPVVRQLHLTPGPVTPQRKEKYAFEKLFERPRPSPRTPPQKQKERSNRSEGERKIREWMASDKPQHPWKRTCAELVKYLSAHLQNIDSIDALQQLATPRTHLLLQTPERKFVIPSNTAAIQYIEQEDIDNVNIVYKVRGDQRITKAATLSKIIEKISVANFELEREFIESFFLTYRCYTNPEAIFDMFLQRYELIREKKHDKLAMQNILMFWWEFCFQIDWMPSNRMMITIGKFLESARKDGEKAFVTEFLKLIDKQVALHHKESQEVTDLTLLSNYSVQICQSVLERPSPLFDLDESALAKQLTLIDAKLLCRIRYTELLHPKLFAPYLDRESTYENALRVGASNIVSLLSRYDALANWTASAIVAPTTMDARVKRTVFMTKTCHLLIEMNNHHTALAMAEGLLNPAVLRLKVTRSHLPIQAQRSLEFIRQFHEKHDRQDREVTMMQLLDDEEIPSHLLGMTPCLPFIHPILKRLTIVEDAYLPRIKVTGEKLIHLDKYVQIFRTQNLIREFQSVCNFGFTWNDSIYTKLQKNMTYRQTQAVIMKWSCKRE